MKEVFTPLNKIIVNRVMEFYSNEHDVITKGIVEKDKEEEFGYTFTYTVVDMEEPDKRKTHNLLLSKESSLDKEDLRNINEILQENKLNFVKFQKLFV